MTNTPPTNPACHEVSVKTGICKYCNQRIGGVPTQADTPRTDKLSFLELYDIIDGWYHEHTRHHLADIDGDVAKNMLDPLMAAIDADREQAVVEATTPPLDLNAYENQLSSQVSDIDAFNLFIKKWCPRAAHLLDTDDNDGQYMRDRIEQAVVEARIDELHRLEFREASGFLSGDTTIVRKQVVTKRLKALTAPSTAKGDNPE